MLNAPASLTLDLPPGVDVRHRGEHDADIIIAFVHRLDPVHRHVEEWGRSIFPHGGLWIAWPKKASDVVTDITQHALRDATLPLGLVDNKVCSIDATWTALRFVWRVERRAAGHDAAASGTRRNHSPRHHEPKDP